LWVAGADGSYRREITSGADDYGASVSPDGRAVSFTSTRGGGIPHIWRVDMDGRNLRQLTFGNSEDQRPRWTPDGKWIIFQTWRIEGKLTVWKMPAEGGEPVQLSDKSLNLQNLSPDGKLLACYDGGMPPPGKTKVFLLPIEGGEPMKVLELPPSSGGLLSWTADGRAITYSISSGSVDNIWALPLDGGKPVQLTNFNASSGARDISFYALARDGKRLAITRYNVTNSLVLISDFK
jgi:Tol biopolymer transport system component